MRRVAVGVAGSSRQRNGNRASGQCAGRRVLARGRSEPTAQQLQGRRQDGLSWAGRRSFAPSSFPLGIQIDGQYHRLKQKASVGDRTNQIIMGTANLIYKFKTSEDSKFRPYLIGGGGIYNFKLVSGSDVAGPGVGNTGNTATKFGFNAGAGFDIKAGGVGFFAEGRFHDVFTNGPNTKFIPITVGIRLGGN